MSATPPVPPSPTSPLDTIDDLPAAMAAGLPSIRRVIAGAPGMIRRIPLIPGTESFAGSWLPDWHGRDVSWIDHDIACYSLMDARVSGEGQIWLRNRLITSTEIMPEYVAAQLRLAEGGSDALRASAALPVRMIRTPCLVAIGHGTRVYGHFLIDMLFRILVARRALAETGLRYRILLDAGSPDWLLRILREDLRIAEADIAFFTPETEQVMLQHALVPTRPFQMRGFNPAANDLLEELLAELDLSGLAPTPPRPFIARGRFHNPAAPYRVCVNEGRLIEIAAQRHGFTPVSVEAMSWRHQIALFREAQIVLGLAGSGLHTALFSPLGSCLASVGLMNLAQSDIGNLRRQHNAFLDNGPVSGEFTVDEARFTQFLDAVCSGWAAMRASQLR